MPAHGQTPYLYDVFDDLSSWSFGPDPTFSVTTPPGVTNGQAATCAGENDVDGDPLAWLLTFVPLQPPPEYHNIEILTRCQANSDDEPGTAMGILARVADIPPNDAIMYQAGFADDANGGAKSLSILRVHPGLTSAAYGRVALSVVPFDWNPNTWYWLRFRVVASTLRAKAWADGDPEPNSWMLQASDSTIFTGNAGVFSEYNNVGARQYFDFASFDTRKNPVEAPAYLGSVGSRILSAEQLFSHSILDDPNIYPERIDPAGGIFTPSIAFPVGPTEFIPSAEQIFEHGIHDDVDTLLAPLMPSSEEVFTPTTLAHATVTELIDESEVFAPRIKRDWVKPEFKSTRDEPVEHWQHESLTNRLPRNEP